MSSAQRLVCLRPSDPPQLSLQTCAMPTPGKGQVVLRVEATSVNPIDVKRANGYGQRLLKFKGAGQFPLVLGNDVAGVVEAVAPGVSVWRAGDHAYGVVPTGKGGAHASHVVVESQWLRPFVSGRDALSLAALPYTFTTLWRTLRQAGINERNACGLAVLVHGASGGLGQLALQLLSRWGASVTAICSSSNIEICRSLGATTVWDRTRQALTDLPQTYDLGLNFGAWADEEKLVRALRRGAIGYATTVHPLLSNFDRYGWLAGAWRSRQDLRHPAGLAQEKGARYGWVVFQPEKEALDVLHHLLSIGGAALPVGIATPLSAAMAAFSHVARHLPGRALLLP